MEHEVALRVIRVKLWEYGHSFEEIDSINLQDLGDILAYWQQKGRIDTRLAKERKRKRG